ncbi:MAG: hypothetical protein EOP04_18850 [Proteobacteria bacterium]|nr:MAG: hypothetical protein EOP04_18850 [Pseudomonadota bacterium]
MRFTTSSILYRIPVELEPRQRLLLEGIRYSVNMLFISWGQLKDVLQQISYKKEFDSEKYQAFMSAWTVVDCLDRIKSLFSKLSSVGFENLYDSVADLRAMRNTYHHIYDRVDTSIELNYPLLGVLSWSCKSYGEQNFLHLNMIAAGAQLDIREYEFINPAGQVVDIPIGMVTLRSVIREKRGGALVTTKAAIDLSLIMHELDIALDNFEKLLSSQFSHHSLSGNFVTQDILVGCEFHPPEGTKL